ncbi:MAG: hypothetical protein IJS26_03575 [Alphaproteobacteria bacterium]|nr:hypothetical protein [Alphaproteobacteria bacterium]
MNNVIEDFEGKKFEVTNKGTDNEVWTSVDNPDWKFQAIDITKYQGEDALNLGLSYSVRATNCDADEDLNEVMPIIDKMFLPTYKDRYIQETAKMGNIICVCNASTHPSSKYEGSVFAARANTGLGALTRYWSEHVLYLNPGQTSFGDDKRLEKIRYESSLKCLDMIEAREKVTYLDSNINAYLKKLTAVMDQAVKENAFDRVIALAEQILERNIKESDYDTIKIMDAFWTKAFSIKPELADRGRPYIRKVREVGDSLFNNENVDPFYRGSRRVDREYVISLEKAFNSASDENRLKLLNKIAETMKTTSILNSYDMYSDLIAYTSSNHMYRQALIPQNKQEEKILIDILETTATRKDSLSFHVALLQQKPELARVLLPIMGKVLANKDSYPSDETATWIRNHYEQYKDIIKTDKGLMKALDSEFIQQVALKDLSIIPSLKGISRENFDAFAKIYEEEYAKAPYDFDKKDLKQKNIVLDKENNEIMNTIKNNILENGYEYGDTSKSGQVWLVKNAKKYPNLVSECLKTKELPYVEMCIKNIENPEKENIGSLLNRLEAKDAKTFADFQDAQDFVARRDMCMRATGRDQQLSYDMAEAGVSDFRTAKRINDLFITLNERPETYGSCYNEYYPKDLLPIAKSNVMQDWMYPVMMDAIRNEVLSTSEGRMPSERTLFDCCKAWKVCPQMPQRLAKEVGTYSLKGRMLAGAIFEKMVEEGKTTQEEWRENKELHQKFYEEFNRAQKMPREKAFKQYIPNTPVNRKRVIGMGMEEKGIENTPENFKTLYHEAREKGIFDKMLAKPEDARTTFSSRLLVETARRKFNQSR